MADRRLQVFYTVAKQLSFTKAAEQLFMTQPAVTFQVKQLEEHFNTRLFERSHAKIALTPAGRMVMQYAERILALSEELDKRVILEDRGLKANGRKTCHDLAYALAHLRKIFAKDLLGIFRVAFARCA